MSKVKGFTMVELMVVVAVIGILAAVLMPQVGKMVEKSRIGRVASEITTISKAIDAYMVDVGSYPPGVGNLGRSWGDDVGLVDKNKVTANHQTNWNGPYLKAWPTKTPWGKASDNGWAGVYYIHQPHGQEPINRDGISGNDIWIYITSNTGSVWPKDIFPELDKMLDDGDATTGNVRIENNGSEFYYYVGEGTRRW